MIGRATARLQAQPAATSATSASTSPSGSWRSASTSTSSPASRAASLVTGPIETTRARAGKPSPTAATQIPHRRRGGEGHVVGVTRGLDRRRVRLLGDGLVQSHDVHLGAPLTKRVGQDVARLGGAGDEDGAVGDVEVAQRLDERLGDRLLRHHVGADPVLGERRRGARARSRRPSRWRARARRVPPRRAPRTAGSPRSGWSGRRARTRGWTGPRRAPRPSRAGARSGSPAARQPRRRAPRSVAARPLAWARARVTTTRRPWRGRRSSQRDRLAPRRHRADQHDRGRAEGLPRTPPRATRRGSRSRSAGPASCRAPRPPPARRRRGRPRSGARRPRAAA